MVCILYTSGQREILRNISFCLEEQKIMTILGPNGVGKTTLLKCIMGFLPWNRGEARILEKNLNVYSDKELWKQISYVPQAKRSAFSYVCLLYTSSTRNRAIRAMIMMNIAGLCLFSRIPRSIVVSLHMAYLLVVTN